MFFCDRSGIRTEFLSFHEVDTNASFCMDTTMGIIVKSLRIYLGSLKANLELPVYYDLYTER